MEDVFTAVVIFSGFYFIIKVISDHLLRRKIIMMGHVDKAGILEQKRSESEASKYPSLKWGLVALCGGLGLIISEMIRMNSGSNDWENPLLPLGIVLVAISAGFLGYFFIVNRKK